MAWFFCEYCTKPITPGEPESYMLVEGWVRIRPRGAGGGVNAVSEQKALGKYIHGMCWKERKLDGAEQQSLL